MAEILKAGDGEATAEEEPEDVFAEEYEPASMKDEAKMLENMDFAIQELGEIATKVQDLVNFVNPYCGTEINESGDQPKFKVGDVVRVMGVSGMDFYGRDAPIGPIVEIQPPHPDVGVYEYLIKGRSGEFFAYEDELELVPERFTEEENSKMKKITKERGGFGLEPDYDDLPDDWGSWNNYDGDEDDEGWDMDSSDYEMSDDERKEAWRERHPYLEKGKDDGGPWLSEKEIIGMKVTGESGGKMSINLTSAEESDLESCIEDYIIQAEEKHGSESDMVIMTAASKALRWIEMICAKDCWRLNPEDVIINWADDSGVDDEFAPAKGNSKSVYDLVAEMYEEVSDYTMGSGTRGKPESDDEEFMEDGGQKLKNELKKGDDGWTTIGQPVSEAKVVVDANDVWDVLELLDNDIANKELTDLINSHVRSEEEIMDAINELCGETISKNELNTLLSGRMATLVDYLGLDVERYDSNGEFVDSDKPTSVELESVEAGETKKVTLSVDWDDEGAGLDNNVVVDVPAEIADSEETDALYDYISDWIDQQDFAVNDWMITDIEGLMDEGSNGGIKDGDKQLVQEAWKDVLGLAAGAVMGGLTMGPLGILIGAWSGHGVQEFFHKRNALKNITDSQLFVLASLKALGKNGASMKNFIQTSGGKIKEEDVQELIRIDAITVQLIGDNITLSEEGQEILDKAGYDEKAFQAAAKEEAEDKAEEERIAAEETGDGQKPEEVKSQDKTFNQDGENKTLVAGEENQKPVCEMTIEQEVPSPQSLSRLLWEQGKEHLMELLTSEYVDNDAILPTLEDMGLRNLTEINDAFAYDFETILDSLGCDPDAWAERLEIVKKGGEEPVDEAKKKTKGAGDPEA